MTWLNNTVEKRNLFKIQSQESDQIYIYDVFISVTHTHDMT